MSLEIKWNDTDPETGEKRIVSAEKKAGRWLIRWKASRRGEWRRFKFIPKEMWEFILESLVRREVRREATAEDVEQVRTILRQWKERPRTEAMKDSGDRDSPEEEADDSDQKSLGGQ